MTLNHIDRGIVGNLRRIYEGKIARYSDEVVIKAWCDFSLSDEYPDKDAVLFPAWCESAQA